jgi:Tfp pilus assembly protein PilO
MDLSGIHDSGLFPAMLIIVIGIVLMLIWAFWIAFAAQGETHRKESMRESAEETLRRRFAQREISEEPGRYRAPTQEEISAHRLQQWYDEIGRAADRLRKNLPTQSTEDLRQFRR